ncbi:hypothetical protein BJF79_36020 [Actinomadura sp. CNU-125]|nr:hypothetical protein [Actinomadura sp. CNU-125]OLT32472.1 hypothetical protein BJF79_36020 [Actinomadura sp. CNU-125]
MAEALFSCPARATPPRASRLTASATWSAVGIDSGASSDCCTNPMISACTSDPRPRAVSSPTVPAGTPNTIAASSRRPRAIDSTSGSRTSALNCASV